MFALRGGSVCAAVLLSWGGALQGTELGNPVRLITLDPGHFHAALFQKDKLPGVSDEVLVYAPLGADLTAHLNRIALFNSRADDPTCWKLEVHARNDFLEHLLRDQAPGQVVVISGRNRDKIVQVRQLVHRGFHVLADKPWILQPHQLAQLQEALDDAEQKGVAAWDAMTQRYEITCLLQRELVQDPAVFGECQSGSPAQPAVELESLHYLSKEVAGIRSLRPPWFFDIHEQGEGLTDVGTHLIDLVQWTLCPGQELDCERDLLVCQAARWPTQLTVAQFRHVTGQEVIPGSLEHGGDSGLLQYFANNSVTYSLRGVHVRVRVRWDFAALGSEKESGSAIYRGTRATVEVRQGPEEGYRPEVFIRPGSTAELADVRSALERKIQAWQRVYPGLCLHERSGQFQVIIPECLRVGHEAHFALLSRQFLEYVRNPGSLPKWEKSHMLAKYFVSTTGVALARQRPSADSASMER